MQDAPPTCWMSVNVAACRGDMHYTCDAQRLCRASTRVCVSSSVRACGHTICPDHGCRDLSQTLDSRQLFPSRLSTYLCLQGLLSNIVSQPGSCEHWRSSRNLCSLLAPASPAERVQRGQDRPEDLFNCPHDTAILQTQDCALAEGTPMVGDLQQQNMYSDLCPSLVAVGGRGERGSRTAAGETLDN